MEAAGAGLEAGSCIVIMPVRVMSYSKAESEKSGFMGTGSSRLGSLFETKPIDADQYRLPSLH
jgi:hypothetical protein